MKLFDHTTDYIEEIPLGSKVYCFNGDSGKLLATDGIFIKLKGIPDKIHMMNIKGYEETEPTYTREQLHAAFCAGADHDMGYLKSGEYYYRFTEWLNSLSC